MMILIITIITTIHLKKANIDILNQKSLYDYLYFIYVNQKYIKHTADIII